MTRSNAPPLAELLELLYGVTSGKGQSAIQHGRHVTGVEEESVTAEPCGIVGVGYKELRIEHINEIGATHGTARMT